MAHKVTVYNTLSKKEEEFIPQKADQVLMYTCGVTVYDDIHIGHIRSLYFFELVKRIFQYAGYSVKWARNITDIDDKIINKAREVHGSGVEYSNVSAQYIERFYEDLKAFDLDKADEEPLATQTVDLMIDFIKDLIDKEYAYVTDTGVYFSVKKFAGYGKLSGQSIENLQESVRLAQDETKKDPLDFALWKKSKDDEPVWDSPWMPGRPGWHIECSSMCHRFLAPTLDIHGGGVDLSFPHHENERAQSEAFTGATFAQYWIHHGLIFVEGKKMSKSLGNFITARAYLEKGAPDALKLFMLTTSYRSPLDFSWPSLQHASNELVGLKKVLYYLNDVPDKDISELKHFAQEEEEFKSALCSDFDTPNALACLHFMQSKCIDGVTKAKGDIKDDEVLIEAKYVFKKMLAVLGVLKGFKVDPGLKKDIQQKILQRQEFRVNKEFQKADAVRDELVAKGIVLEDLPGKRTVWYKE